MERKFLEMLRCHSENQAGNIAFQVLGKDGELYEEADYGLLWEVSLAVAAQLSSRCKRGDRVIISQPTSLNYIYTLLGCLIAGIVAVPFYPVKNRNKAKQLVDLVKSCDSSLIVTTSEDCSNLSLLLNNLGLDIGILGAEALFGYDNAINFKYEPQEDCSVAYIQYTSGSTSKPKGVRISNGNLTANVRYLTDTVCGTSDDVFVNWLPLYHDMGLVITVLWPIYLGAKSILLPSASFVSNPLVWIKSISDNKGTICGGPNFCYELCLEKIPPSSLSFLDLSSWQIAFNSAEPVLEKTLRRFSSYFMVSGFNDKAFYPCYGMAEATVFFSGKGRHSGYSSLNIDKDLLRKNRVRMIEIDSDCGTHVVSCGGVGNSHSFKILGLDAKDENEDLEVGEICIAGPSIFDDYWLNEGDDQSIYRNGKNIIIGNCDYYKTGDLGFSFKGELYITGRLKDIIIVKGKNYYPNDIENSIQDSHYAIRRGGCAVFVLCSDDQEELVGVVELKKQYFKDVNTRVLAGIVRKHILADQNIYLNKIVFTRPFVIPLTSSGKVQRSKLAKLYINGELKGIDEKVNQNVSVIPPSNDTERELVRIWSLVLKRDVISINSDYFDLGGSSIEAIEILARIHEAFPQVEIKQDSLIKYSNVASLAKFIDVCLLRAGAEKASESKTSCFTF